MEKLSRKAEQAALEELLVSESDSRCMELILELGLGSSKLLVRPKPRPGLVYTIDEQGKTIYMHRMIWEAHHGLIPAGSDVFHRNADTLDNRLANLELRRKGAPEYEIAFGHCLVEAARTVKGAEASLRSLVADLDEAAMTKLAALEVEWERRPEATVARLSVPPDRAQAGRGSRQGARKPRATRQRGGG